MKAVLGLGTNQGEREQNLQNAISALQLVPNIKILRLSSVIETKPYGYLDQPNFLNMVLEIETEFSPKVLLGACLGIEAGLGRIREFKNGPRMIDIDVLVCENQTVNTAELTVPHPEILNRSFVLVPLKELFPSGKAYDFSFLEAYNRHPKNDYYPFHARSFKF